MGLEIDPDAHLVATCGGTEAMLVAIMTVCNPGDAVIIFSPFYENYGADTILSGARPIYVPLHPPGFGFDRDELRRAFAQKPRAIVICNPSNPCGKVFTEEELIFIGELAREHDAFLITDEVYEHIVYAPHRHVYTAALPDLWERTLTVGSLSKTYAITGWRLGYVLAPGADHRAGAQGARFPDRRRAAPACRKRPSRRCASRRNITKASPPRTPGGGTCSSTTCGARA